MVKAFFKLRCCTFYLEKKYFLYVYTDAHVTLFYAKISTRRPNLAKCRMGFIGISKKLRVKTRKKLVFSI